MKFGRMMYFDDLLKDLWFVIGFSKIRCHGNQKSFFLIFFTSGRCEKSKILIFHRLLFLKLQSFFSKLNY